MSGPRISVVIPTRERADVLAFALRTVTAQAYDDLEIVVSDNQSGDATRQVVLDAHDPRIRYVNTGRRVGMSDNWETGLAHATGEWVTVIGDDDGLLPGAIARVAEIARDGGIAAIRSRLAFYSWPSLFGTAFGKLIVPLQTGHQVRRSRDWIARVLAARASYVDLPMIYNGGFIRRTVLDGLRSRDGRLLRSVTPDVYAAIAVANAIPEYLFVEEPLALSGGSGHSIGRAFLKGSSGGVPAKVFTAEANLPWHSALPLTADGGYPRSIEAIVYEAYLQALAPRELPRAMHAEQLELSLAMAGAHRDTVEPWAIRFAALHGLDFARARRRAAVTRLRVLLARLPTRVAEAIERTIVGSPEVPLLDVVEASQLAPRIRAAPPGRGSRIAAAAKRFAMR